MKIALLYFLLVVVSQCAAAANNSSEPMVYRYWDWSITKSRDDYQVAALTLALEKTLASHGPYQILRVREPYTGTRVLREIQTGKTINLHAAPARAREDILAEVTENTSITVKVPLMNGLLGYRQLIVRKDDLEKFQQITDENQLKTLIVGQGENWEDVHIYRHNGYTVNDAGTYLALTNMLFAKRFDYLPMSIIEVENMLSSAKNSHQLAVVDNLMLYYPLPLYFYVSKQHPELAARLEQGLQLAQRDGSLDALLETHFAEHFEFLKQGKARILVLKNPAVPKNMGLHEPKFIKQ
jgi:hypothetical protein